MSAVRRNDRRVHRNNLASPYARPFKSNVVHPQKKSPWSLSGLISFLNPFGSNTEPEDSDSGPSDGEIERGSPPRRFSPPPQLLLPPPPPPQQQSSSNSSWSSGMNGPSAASGHVTHQPFSSNVPSPASSGSSLAKNLEPVTRFLVEKAGQPLNDFEAAGIVDYIQKNVQGPTIVPDKPEPFRFSMSPSRSVSPNHAHGVGNIQAPRKTLSRNPNGPYRWQGAGSSRPRNRYQSPGFAPRSQQLRIKLSPPKTPVTTDTKRRRVGDEAESSTPQKPTMPSTSTTSFPRPIPESPIPSSRHATGPSAIFLNGKPTVSSTLAPAPPVTPKANGVQPRIRTGGLPMKPTTPAIPSPLRQTWKESDSPPQASPPSRPTRAADFMTELIKEVTPTKPDVSNPYQTASPVKPPPPVRRPMAKRAKPASKPVEQPKAQEPEMSAQAIIEATVPKGTKRSRPPPEIEKLTRVEEVLDSESLVPAPNGSTHTIRSIFNVVGTVTVMEGEENPSKRRKTPPARPSSRDRGIDGTSASKAIIRPAEVIEPADDNVHINGKQTQPSSVTLSPPSSMKQLFAIPKTSAPKEPSKLRYSFRADKVEVKGADASPAPSLPSFLAPPPVPSSTSIVSPAKSKLSPKEEALAMSVDELPKYMFPVRATSYPAGLSFSAERSAVLSLAATSLPNYEFATVIAPMRAMNGFNWTAAGLKSPTIPAQTWQCSLCQLQNTADAKEKCAVCDAARPAPVDSSSPSPVSVPVSMSSTPTAIAPPTAPVKRFDWSAAGLAPPPKPQIGTWTCSTCSLSNPASATEKCSICDTPR